MNATSQLEPTYLSVSEDIRVRFPELDETVSQDKEYCTVHLDGVKKQTRFHDYDEVYSIPGLYEKIFYEHLGCCSPEVVTNLLKDTLRNRGADPATLSVLEIGAGNGMVGECLRDMGVETIIGVDILIEAKLAAFRDRPHVYTDYFALDLTNMPETIEEGIASLKLNSLVSVAALGFDDLPPFAYANAFNLIQETGWIAFNIKDEFLNDADDSGFSKLMRNMIHEGILEVDEKVLYKHREAIDGTALKYFAIVGRKTRDIPGEWLDAML